MRNGGSMKASVVIRLDDFGHGHAELVFHKNDFAACDQSIVDVNVDRLADLAIEVQYGARSKLEQVANFHMGAAEHRGHLDRHVKDRFEVSGAAVDGFGIRGHQRACIGHDLDVTAVFEVGERYL